MKIKKTWMLILASLVLLVAGCSAADAKVEGAGMAGPTAIPVSALTTDDVRRITLSDAKALLDSDEAVLYDVRSADQYQAQHAAGAISLPESAVAARFRELPADQTLIFYCT
jgi:3-mercaptopyruvate sulfurtransferase SseA